MIYTNDGLGDQQPLPDQPQVQAVAAQAGVDVTLALGQAQPLTGIAEMDADWPDWEDELQFYAGY